MTARSWPTPKAPGLSECLISWEVSSLSFPRYVCILNHCHPVPVCVCVSSVYTVAMDECEERRNSSINENIKL